MYNKIQETQNRLIRYDYVDGTPDLAFGGLCLLMTIIYALFAAFPGLSNSTFSAIIVWVVFCGGCFLIGWLPQRLKERVTYPRTGYVAYKRQGRPIKSWARWTIRVGMPLLTVILLALIFLNRSKFPAQSQDTNFYLNPGIAGLLFSGILAAMGWKIALSRYYLVAAITILISIVLLFSGPGGNLGLAVLSGAMCLVLFASGGITLWRYLRQNPAPREEPDEQ
ncbi:MAG: hypothetical protein FD146_2451 [Anaerolineaceae bacterium]|nr:MAG: hypothetical protein FD146_2451 [Anaerolineaceae bacterium]